MPSPVDDPKPDPGDPSVRFMVIIPLCIASFSGLLSVAVLGPFVAVVAADLDTSVPRIGLAATAALLTTAISGLAVGWLSDVAGFRRVLVAGLAILGTSGVIVALSVSYSMFLVARIVGAVGFSAASGLPNAIAATRYSGQTRQRALGYISAASVLAGLLGPPLLTFIGDLTSWRVAFAVVAGFAIIAGVSVRLLVPAPPADDSPGPTVREGMRAYRRLLTTRTVRYALIANYLQMAAIIGAMVYVGAYLTDEVGVSVRYVGFAFAAQSLGGLLASFLAGRVPEHRGIKVYFAAMLALSGCLAIIYAVATPFPVTTLVMAIAGASQVTAWVLLVGVLARSSPVGQGSTMVFNGSVLGAGGATGSALGGLIISQVGYPLLGLAFAVLAVCSAIAMALASRNQLTGTH